MKTNQIPAEKAKGWMKNFEKEKQSSQLKWKPFFLEKSTYEKLTGDAPKRIRIYLGLEKAENGGQEVVAFAVATAPDATGVFRDLTDVVFKLGKENIDYSAKTEEVKAALKAWREWKKSDSSAKAKSRESIYPNGFLTHDEEFKEILAKQGKKRAIVEFGMEEQVTLLLASDEEATAKTPEISYFDFMEPCPPVCDSGSDFVRL